MGEHRCAQCGHRWDGPVEHSVTMSRTTWVFETVPCLQTWVERQFGMAL